MNKIKITISIFVLFLITGIVLFVNQERISLNDQKLVFVDKIMIPVIELDEAFNFGEEVNWDRDIMEKAQEKGEYIGCGDKISYIEKKIEPTIRPLEAIYLELFKGNEAVKETEYHNPISNHIDTLIFNDVIIENNIAKVYLLGEYFSIGTCEPPRTEAVLIFAAKQYPWIESVEIYLNNQETEFIHGGK